MSDNVIRLADASDAAHHWTPADALAFATERAQAIGARVLLVSMVAADGSIEFVQCGLSAELVLLAQQSAAHQLADFTFAPTKEP